MTEVHGGNVSADALLNAAAPLCGIEAGVAKIPTVIHAVTEGAIVAFMAGSLLSLVSPCGKRVKLLSVPIGNTDPILWPLSTIGLPAELKRCVECHRQTGKQRPRARLHRMDGGGRISPKKPRG